jgi:transcriptional regulator with XRE-family HTH domain
LTSLKKLFGSNLRQRRKIRGWTQAELAERVSLSLDMIGRLERGDAAPSFETIGELSHILEVSIGELFAGAVTTPVNESPRAKTLSRILELLSRANDADLKRVERIILAALK